VPARLHTGGRFRRWLGRRLGGDAELGDRAWRRLLHGLGAAVLIYYALPVDSFVVLPKDDVLVLALAVVLVLETLRHLAGLELPTIRAYEAQRIASFVFFSVALVGAILLLPEAIAAAVILGTALVDPLSGELRLHRVEPWVQYGVPVLVYVPLAVVGLAVIGRWPIGPSVGLALLAAVLAVAVEQPKLKWADDDLAMTFVAGLALYVVGVVVLGLPH
jgi:hypothetical protein